MRQDALLLGIFRELRRLRADLAPASTPTPDFTDLSGAWLSDLAARAEAEAEAKRRADP